MKRTALKRRTPLTRKTRLTAKGRTRQRDHIFSLAVRESAGWRCQLTLLHNGECRGVLQCCHIFGKQAYPHLRYEPLNALAGCQAGHMYGTTHPFEWFEFCRRRLGHIMFEELKRRAMSPRVQTSQESPRWTPKDGDAIKEAVHGG